MDTGYGVGEKRHKSSYARESGKKSRICHGPSALLEVPLPDLLDKEDLRQFIVEDLEEPNQGCSPSQVFLYDGNGVDDYGGDGECLFPEQTRDDGAESTEQGVLRSVVPSCSISRTPMQATANYEEEALSGDEDEDLFCDDCNKKYHGDCPVHGPLSELDPTAGYDQASITYTQLPVPAQLTVGPSEIPGAGLGIFAVSFINKGVRVGPYEGKKVSQEDVGDLDNMAYVWQIRHKMVNAYLIDGQDPSHSNWMRFVNCARHEDEQNVLAYQYQGSIYYRTIRTIYPESELLVWYGEKVAKELDIDLDIEDSLATGDKPLKCEHCEKSFNWNSHLKEHLKTHTGDKSYKCGQCAMSFSRNKGLQRHLRIHTGEKAYKCDQCAMSFSRNNRLQQHLRIHTGEKPYKCELCGKKFNRNSHLKVHLRTHTGDKSYKCGQCATSFSRNHNLQQHLRIHTGEMPYKCDQCARSFRRTDTLQVHLRTHTGDKPFKCDQCATSYSRNISLQVHLRMHTGEKPYKCGRCAKCFSHTNSLRLHLRIHEKPYKCDQCAKTFSRTSSLQGHLRTHTGDKPYKCDQCAKTFCWSSSLKLHLRMHNRREAIHV